MSPPAVDINADARAPSGSIAAPSTVDIDTDIGALLPPARALITGTHLRPSVAFVLRCSSAFSATIAAARIGSLSAGILAASTRSLLVALLYFQHRFLRINSVSSQKCSRRLMSTYTESEHRCSGTQHQQVSHWNDPFPRLIPLASR